jgi:hypothetical protein
MSSSTTRARWSLTEAATTRVPRGRMTAAGSLRRTWSSCWVGAELGQVRPRPVSGQPRREASSSTCRGHVQVAHQQPRRHPGSGQPSQLPRLADVVALPVGHVGGRHGDRTRPHLDGADQRTALLAPPAGGAAGARPGQGQPGYQLVAVGRAARVGAGQRTEVITDQGRRIGPEPDPAQGLGDRRWRVEAAAAGQLAGRPPGRPADRPLAPRPRQRRHPGPPGGLFPAGAGDVPGPNTQAWHHGSIPERSPPGQLQSKRRWPRRVRR